MGLSAFLPYVLLWHPMSTARKSPPILPPASQYIHRPGCPRCFEQHGALLVHRQGRQPVLLGRRPRRQNRGSEKYLISWHMRARRLEGFGGNSTLHHLLLLPDGRILAKYHHESLGQLDGGITMHCSSSLTALTCDSRDGDPSADEWAKPATASAASAAVQQAAADSTGSYILAFGDLTVAGDVWQVSGGGLEEEGSS